MKPGNRQTRGANSCRIILKDEDLFYFKRSSFIEGALLFGMREVRCEKRDVRCEKWDAGYGIDGKV